MPPLDPGFRPAVLANRAFREEVAASGAGVPLVLGLERPDGALSRFETVAFPDGHPRAGANLFYAERLVKFLLWQRGGWQVYVGGPRGDRRAHRARLLARTARARSTTTSWASRSTSSRSRSSRCARRRRARRPARRAQPLGRHLDGCRIGFDLGASDRKVSAVVDGEAVFSEEVVWEPREQTDPAYHYRRDHRRRCKLAASKLPRVDAIGGSSAGVYVDNRPMVASLFRGIPKERFGEIRDMFLRIRDEFGVPLEVVNDGDVTALAGSMSLEDNGVLGHRAGLERGRRATSTPEGTITGWLNELAFAPVDYSPDGAGRRVVGRPRRRRAVLLAAVRVPPGARRSGIEHARRTSTDAEKLKHVQEQLEAGHDGAPQDLGEHRRLPGLRASPTTRISTTLKHVLILGRVHLRPRRRR